MDPTVRAAIVNAVTMDLQAVAALIEAENDTNASQLEPPIGILIRTADDLLGMVAPPPPASPPPSPPPSPPAPAARR